MIAATRAGSRLLARTLGLSGVFLAVSITPACNQRAVESWLSQAEAQSPGPSLYGDEAFGRALGDIKKRIPASTQVLSLLFYADHIVLQAEDPNARGSAVQYVYRAGTLSAAVPVKLLGKGKLEDNLFPLEAAKIDAIPRLARDAQARANIPEGRVARILLKRNLPESMDIQFRVFVTSQRRDAYLDADQNANLIE